MKQTVAILTALMLALLLVSGFIVTGSMQQSRALLEKEETVRALQTERDHLKTQNEAQQREMERNTLLLNETIEARDALSQQWNDAVLSSQEANDALAAQEERGEAQARHIAELEQRVKELTADLIAAQEEAASAPKPTRFERTVTKR